MPFDALHSFHIVNKMKEDLFSRFQSEEEEEAPKEQPNIIDKAPDEEKEEPPCLLDPPR